MVASDARTGQVKYFDKHDIRQDNYNVCKASCAIPFVCHPYKISGIPCYDGALGNPEPIQKPFQLGCDQVVVILSKPKQQLRTWEKDEKLAAHIRKKYSAAADKAYTLSTIYEHRARPAADFLSLRRVSLFLSCCEFLEITWMSTYQRTRLRRVTTPHRAPTVTTRTAT